MKLIGAFRNHDNEPLQLQNYVDAVANKPIPMGVDSGGETYYTMRTWTRAPPDLKSARSLIDMVLRNTKLAEARLGCRGTGVRGVVEAQFKLENLQGALEWMIWFDEFRHLPLQFCSECNTPFQAEYRHTRKYCSPECGHRVAAREWARKKRGGHDGTQKTR